MPALLLSLACWSAIAWCATGEPFFVGAAAALLVEGMTEGWA